jgi:hypothetical protein
MKKINLTIYKDDAQALLEDLTKFYVGRKEKTFHKIVKNLSEQLEQAERKEIEYIALYLYDLDEQELFDLWVSADANLFLCADVDGELFVCDIEPKDVDEDKYIVPEELEEAYSFGYIEYYSDGHRIDLDRAHSLNSIEMPNISTEDLRQMLFLFDYLDEFRITGIPK